MKATIVLLAGTEAENFGRKIMLEAHKAGNVGFEMARLPQHVSLKQPFSIPSLEQMEQFFDEFSSGVGALSILFEELELCPNNVIGGIESGCLSIRAHRSQELDVLQKRLFRELEEHFGPCPAEHDNDYVFHMTVSLGGAPFQNYKKAYEKLKEEDVKRELYFDKLGLLYYDDDHIRPGTYFCYKIVDITTKNHV